MSSEKLHRLKDYYELRFFLRKYGGITHAEFDNLLLYELDIEVRLVSNFIKMEKGA